MTRRPRLRQRPVTVRRWVADVRHRIRSRGSEGLTLFELIVSMAVLMILLTMTTAIMTNFYSNENQLSGSYSAFAQVLPASTSLQQFFRTLVEPAAASTSTGVPVPAFTPVNPSPPGPASGLQGPFNISPASATFASDLGNANGPSLITITTTANVAPPGTYTLTVTTASPTANSCPGTGPTLGGTACTWGTSDRAFRITDLINGSPTAPSPVFQYTLAGSTVAVPYSTTPGSPWVTDFGAGSCTTIAACPVSQIQTVTIDLEVQAPGGGLASYQTLVSALAPYYSKFVG